MQPTLTIPQSSVREGASSKGLVSHSHHTVVVIGGGTAGITVTARLLRAVSHLDVAVIEPSADHYYQPLWTLVGGGVFSKERSRRDEASVIPPGATWIRERVSEVDPEVNLVRTSSGKRITYDYLIVAPGIQLDWSRIEGLDDNLGRGGICSVYDYRQAERTQEMLAGFMGGEAIFTAPGTPVKCGGAPQKIMYLADAIFRKRGIRDHTRITFATAGTVIFGVPGFKEALEALVARKGIETRFRHDLVAIRPGEKKAVFHVADEDGEREVMLSYDLLHVVPPMSAPDFIARSPLAHAQGPMQGWMHVDPFTLQHARYPNVFGLGDVAGLPTAKTGAAIRKQAPVVVENLIAVMEGSLLEGDDCIRYDGYSSCPLVTGNGRLILAEFKYGNEPAPSFPFDQTKERRSMYLLKKYGLPFLYWNLMLKGRA